MSLAGFIKTTSKWERRWAPEALDVWSTWQMPKITARPAANQSQLHLNSSKMLNQSSSRKDSQSECRRTCSLHVSYLHNLLRLLPEFISQGLDLGLAGLDSTNTQQKYPSAFKKILSFRIKLLELQLLLSARLHCSECCQFTISHKYWPDKGQHSWSIT